MNKKLIEDIEKKLKDAGIESYTITINGQVEATTQPKPKFDIRDYDIEVDLTSKKIMYSKDGGITWKDELY